MGLIEIHPRTFTRTRGGTPQAERRFIQTPDVDVEEELPSIGSQHPEFAALVCVRLTETSGYNNDPQQKFYVASYENIVR